MVYLLTGLLVRLVNIGQSLWLDEAISAQVVAQHSLPSLFNNFLPKDFNPPGYYLALKLFTSLFGRTEIGLRSLSLLAGIGTVFLIYKLAQELNLEPPQIAAWLLATSPLHIHYSQEARAYALAAFLTALMFYCFLRFSKMKKYLLSGLMFMIAVFTHYLTVFACLPILLTTWKKKGKFKKLLYFFLPVLFVFSLWLPTFKKQLVFGSQVEGIGTWAASLGKPTLKNLFLVPVKFILGRTSFTNQRVYYLNAFLNVLIYLFILFKAYTSLNSRNKKLLFGWLFLPVSAVFLLSFHLPMFSYFRFLFLLPAFYLAGAKGVEALKGRASFWVSRFLVVLNLFFLLVYFGNQENLRENWKGAVRFIRQSKAQVLVYPEFSEPLEYYQAEYSTTLEDLKRPKVFFVTYGENIIDPEHQKKKRLQKAGYQYQHVTNFNGVTVEEWERDSN